MRLLLLLLLLFGPTASFAVAAPEPYGKRFLSAADLPVPPRRDIAETPDLPAADPRAMERALRERVEGEEARLGPYAPALAETYGDLARLLEDRGAYAEADRYRERALHLVRVNEGLYSPTQGPLVRASLESLRRQGDLEALDARYEYFYRLYGSGQPPFDTVRWTATLEFLRWQREAYLRRIDRDSRRRLIDLYEQNQDLLRTLQEQTPRSAARIHDATLSQLATLYLISDLEPPRELVLSVRGTRVRQDDPREVDLLQQRLDSLQRSASGRGRTILEEALAVTPPTDAQRRAELLLALGDWMLWQGAPGSARDVYDRLWVEAAQADLESLVAGWFEEPVALPVLDVFTRPERSTGPALAGLLDVTESGRAQVRTDETTELLPGTTRLRRYVEAARFRPAYREGRAVRTQGLRRTWVLIED